MVSLDLNMSKFDLTWNCKIEKKNYVHDSFYKDQEMNNMLG